MTDYHSPDELRRYRARLRRQRDYQAEYRARKKEEGSPTREDIAAVVLDLSIRLWAASPDHFRTGSAAIMAEITRRSKERRRSRKKPGFDPAAAEAVIQGLVHRARKNASRRPYPNEDED